MARSVTYPLANHMLEKAEALLSFNLPDTLVLDNGCGSGAISIILSSKAPRTQILATDLSKAMLELVSSQQLLNCQTLQADGMDLSCLARNYPAGFSHTLSNFMNQFAPNPFQPISEMIKVARPGGVIGLGSWGSFDIVELFKAAAQSSIPDWKFPGLWATTLFPETRHGIEEIFRSYELDEVSTSEKQVHMAFDSTDDFLLYFFNSKNPALEKIIQDVVKQHGAEMLDILKQGMAGMIEQGQWDLGRFVATAFITVGRKRV